MSVRQTDGLSHACATLHYVVRPKIITVSREQIPVAKVDQLNTWQ